MQECCICLDPLLKKPVTALTCGHCLHSECWDMISVKFENCPICNTPQFIEEDDPNPKSPLLIENGKKKKKRCNCDIL
tara:strand:- start:7008 stop:7241 length:234 start_codon:yes stop_codon:yes gene_type:complete